MGQYPALEAATVAESRKALWVLTAISAQLLLSRLHDRQLARLLGRGG